TEETRSGSTTTHANYSLPEYDSFLIEIDLDQEGLISIDNSNNTLLELPEFESFHFDPSFPRPPPDVEICLHFEPDVPVIDKFNELNDDQSGSPDNIKITRKPSKTGQERTRESEEYKRSQENSKGSQKAKPAVPIVLADPLVASEVGIILVVSHTGVLDLMDYSSSSDSDPSEDSLPLVPDLPLVSPSGSSSHDTLAPLSEFPLAPIVAPPGIRRRSATLIRPGEAIPFGRPYRTHSNGPRRLLTARKRVGPIPARRLAWRRVSHHSSDLILHQTHLLLVHPQIIPYPNIHHQTPPMLIQSSLGLSSERSLDSSSLSSDILQEM
ncbi:hypothetical protein Tco_0526030, partial [Tanacetum coccineum]